MRCVVELLVNCRTTGVQQIHDTKSKERSDRVTVDQRVDQQPGRPVRVINHLDSRRVLLKTLPICRGETFQVQSLGKSCRGKYAHFLH